MAGNVSEICFLSSVFYELRENKFENVQTVFADILNTCT